MDLEIIILSEVRQRKTNIICFHSHVYFIFLNGTSELIYKTDLQILKANLRLPKGKCGKRRNKAGTWD